MITIPAGKYVLGDPCYSIDDDHWMDLLHSCDIFENPIGKIHGFTVLAFGTAYGDGCYNSTIDFTFPVDAGLIGLVPFEYIEKFGSKYESRSDLSTVVEFNDDVNCYSENGTLHFGNIEIYTGDDEDLENEYDNELEEMNE